MNDKLLEYTTHRKPSEADLESIGDYLIHNLSEYLGQEIACFHKHFVIGQSVALKIRNKTPMPGPFALQWDGSLLYHVQDQQPAIDAYIFLFSHGERLGGLKDNGNGWIILTFGIQGNSGNWYFNYWHGDEYDECTYITRPRKELYDKFERTYG